MKEIEKKSTVALLQLISKALFGGEFNTVLTAEEFGELLGEAYSHAVLAVTFDALPTECASVNPEAYGKWQSYAFNVISNNLNNSFANSKLTELLSGAGIRHCTMKGFAAAEFYPKSQLRQMGDIDFLVSPDDVKNTVEVLMNNGFTPTQDEDAHDFHQGFRKGKNLFEMHRQISSVPEGKEYVFDFADDILPNSELRTVNGASLMLPDAFSHGMILLLHKARHIEQGEGVGLRHLCDWAVFVNSLDSDEFKNTFEKYLKYAGLWEFARIISQICELYLGMPHKEWYEPMNVELAGDLAEDLIQSGNFGRKDPTRAQSTVFVNRSLEKKSYFRIFYDGLRKKVTHWKPFYEKHSYLLPIGFVAYGIRIMFQVITGKKKLYVKEMAQKGVQRNEVYTRLRFYETEK